MLRECTHHHRKRCTINWTTITLSVFFFLVSWCIRHSFFSSLLYCTFPFVRSVATWLYLSLSLFLSVCWNDVYFICTLCVCVCFIFHTNSFRSRRSSFFFCIIYFSWNILVWVFSWITHFHLHCHFHFHFHFHLLILWVCSSWIYLKRAEKKKRKTTRQTKTHI